MGFRFKSKFFSKVGLVLSFSFFASLVQANFGLKTVPIPKELEYFLRATGAYADHCPVKIDRLVTVLFPYYDFSGVLHEDGELITLDVAAEEVSKIFLKLAERKFPVRYAKTEKPDKQGNVKRERDGTGCFYCRNIVSEKSLPSMHSFGQSRRKSLLKTSE